MVWALVLKLPDNVVLFNGTPAAALSATATQLNVPVGNFTGAVIVRSGGLEAIGPCIYQIRVINHCRGSTQHFNFLMAIR